jgi:hypothetical protein
MNGRDFLRAARRYAAGTDEADRRSATSRAYYAAFHVARELLSGLRFRVPRADRAHNYLYVRLNNCGDPAVIGAAGTLRDLRITRNAADYDLGGVFPARDAVDSIAQADAVIRTLDGLSPAQRTQITDAMKLYEQGAGDVTWQP